MRWIVRITNELNKRINVSFDPLNEIIYFRGEYKPKNVEWIVFSEIISPINIDLDIIETKLFEAYELLTKRVDIYLNLSQGFEFIKEIEIKKD
jgi:hypothetical protein